MIVGVEEVALVFRMAGDVNLRDAFRGDGVQISVRIESWFFDET